MEQDRYFTVTEAAEYLKTYRRWIQRKARANNLLKSGGRFLIAKSMLDEWAKDLPNDGQRQRQSRRATLYDTKPATNDTEKQQTLDDLEHGVHFIGEKVVQVLSHEEYETLREYLLERRQLAEKLKESAEDLHHIRDLHQQEFERSQSLTEHMGSQIQALYKTLTNIERTQSMIWHMMQERKTQGAVIIKEPPASEADEG